MQNNLSQILMCLNCKNPELEVSNTEDFLEDLRMDWGVYLKRHLRDVKD